MSALTRARAQGELGADKDPAALGRFLFVLLQGLRVLGRGDAGATVVVAGRNEAPLARTVAERHGRLGIAVNNAGIRINAVSPASPGAGFAVGLDLAVDGGASA